MPKFVSARDFEFFQHINREIVDEIVDADVVLYKIRLESTPVNIYGEALEKVHYVGIELSALISYPENEPDTQQGFGPDMTQQADFRFVRRILQIKDVYPEMGDVILYNDRFFEIDNVREVSLIASRPEYNNDILCSAHLTRRTDIQLEARQL